MDGNEKTERSSGPMKGAAFHKDNLWQEKVHVLRIGDGENTDVVFTDYGNLGVKLDIKCGIEHIAFLIKPSEMDEFLMWISTTGCREILALPPQMSVLLDKVAENDKNHPFLNKQTRSILSVSMSTLDMMVLIRKDEVHDELVIEAGGR